MNTEISHGVVTRDRGVSKGRTWMLAVAALTAGMSFPESSQIPVSTETATSSGKAVEMCQNSVTSLLRRAGYGHITFESADSADTSDRNSFVRGTVSGQRGVTTRFSFSCSVDVSAGKVRDFDLNRR